MKFVRTHKWATTVMYRMTVIKDASLVVLTHKLQPSEVKLNNYLLTTYKKDLKTIALTLIKNCRVMHNSNKTAIILFPNKQDDFMATLITYGTVAIPGSNILKDAFLRKD